MKSGREREGDWTTSWRWKRKVSLLQSSKGGTEVATLTVSVARGTLGVLCQLLLLLRRLQCLLADFQFEWINDSELDKLVRIVIRKRTGELFKQETPLEETVQFDWGRNPICPSESIQLSPSSVFSRDGKKTHPPLVSPLPCLPSIPWCPVIGVH